MDIWIASVWAVSKAAVNICVRIFFLKYPYEALISVGNLQI